MERNPTLTGKFIVIEGPHGVGKTTQVRLLVHELERRNYQVLSTASHQGDEINNAIHPLVVNQYSLGFTDQLVRLFLISAARAARVTTQIYPALLEGKIVITDRYLPSTLVYQSHVGGLDFHDVFSLATMSCKGIFPDLTIILDSSDEILRQRLSYKRGNKGDSLDELPFSYHQKSRRGFLKYAQKFGWKVIDSSEGVEEAQEKIWYEVEQLIING